MAREILRTFHTDQRKVSVILEDDLGHQHTVDVYVTQDRCPCCKRPYEQTAGEPDLQKTVDQVIATLDADADKTIQHFEKHGADMQAHKARRAQNRNEN